MLSRVYIPSDEVVAREIEGELILVPLTAGVGDVEDALYTFNDSGREIWRLLDGCRRLCDLVDELSEKYQATRSEIEQDVVGLVTELVNRRMLVEAPGA
jgi:hypothetical protein